METTTKGHSMKTQEIINEATKLGEAKVGSNVVQARALELEQATGLIFSGSSPERSQADSPANIFWNTYHETKNKAFEISGSKNKKLTTEQKARAKEIIKAKEQEEFNHLVWKYQTRSSYARNNPVSTATLRKWAKTVDTRYDFYLRQALRQAGEL